MENKYNNQKEILVGFLWIVFTTYIYTHRAYNNSKSNLKISF